MNVDELNIWYTSLCTTSTLREDMRRDIMKTVQMYKDKDSVPKRDQQRIPTATHTDTTPVEPCGSSSGWQPPPHM